MLTAAAGHFGPSGDGATAFSKRQNNGYTALRECQQEVLQKVAERGFDPRTFGL